MSAIFLRLAYYIVIAFVVGTIAQVVTGYNKRRFFTTIMLGVIGVILGDRLASYFHLPYIIPPFFGVSLEWATLGAIIFILAYRLIRGEW